MLKNERAMHFVQHEEFDLRLYRKLARLAQSDALKETLATMITEEERHILIWKRYASHMHVPHIGFWSRIKMAALVAAAYVFGDVGIRLIVESIEVHGIREYLMLAHEVRGTELEEPLDEILRDELEHEAQIVGNTYGAHVSAERVRNFFLGFNDGLVEMLGATVGFYATMSHPGAIAIAGLSVISAGSFSMAAGAYAGDRAAYELEKIREAKDRFLATGHPLVDINGAPNTFGDAAIVGGAFIIGGLLPLAPVFLGSVHFMYSVLAAVTGVTVVSVVLAFLTGISIRKRITLNLVLITAAVLFASAIGSVVEYFIR